MFWFYFVLFLINMSTVVVGLSVGAAAGPAIAAATAGFCLYQMWGLRT